MNTSQCSLLVIPRKIFDTARQLSSDKGSAKSLFALKNKRDCNRYLALSPPFVLCSFIRSNYEVDLYFKTFTGELIMYSEEQLWNIRTDLPMVFMLEEVPERLRMPYKLSEGFVRFLCPYCQEMQATVNPKNNLSHCFCCDKNLNNIDFLIAQGCSFKESVDILSELWEKYSRKNNIKSVRQKLKPKPDANKPLTN